MILSRWQTEKLGTLVSFKTGKLDSNAATSHGAYPFFTCSRETYRTDTFSFDTECVLLAGNNANGIYPIKFFKGKFDAYQRTYVIQSLNTERLNNRFLYYALQFQLDHLRRISTGSATKFLTLTILNDLSIPLPPIKTQQKISAFISAYDDLIENNTNRIRILEDALRIFYHKRIAKEIASSSQINVPDGWNIKSLGEIAYESRRSINISQIDPNTAYVGLEHIPRRSIALYDWGSAKDVQSMKLRFDKGDILFGKIRPYFHKVSIAPIAGVCSSDAIVIKPKKPEHYALTLCCVSSDEFILEATQTSQGTKMPRANWDVLKKFPVVVPSQPSLSRFNNIIMDFVAQIENLSMKNRLLRQTRDLVIPKLILREIDVSDLEIVMGELN
ncbi:type I restriction-modification enzyme, S subunit [Capsulimonas corticalis]|uniref:Type I restriction-modification enzyme, S subunit n=1 Tax=Capsulimonas corticalis TaxID=2219043 RepID=A0A402CVZ8_9BACT|nr:restriction endonuclease subunit S [Capsulimonas corticalis]BDI33995.1 type I restriction-modification enzyme, S subunit [Capsulimonas corticalis]